MGSLRVALGVQRGRICPEGSAWGGETEAGSEAVVWLHSCLGSSHGWEAGSALGHLPEVLLPRRSASAGFVRLCMEKREK